MKVLLIHSNRFKKPWPVIPLGLCFVAASVENAGHEVKTIDLCFSRKFFRVIRDTVENFKPDVIGVSIRNIDNCTGYKTVFLLDQEKEIISCCKQLFQGPIVIGGSAVSISGEEMLDFFDLSYAICGDGEPVMVEFLRRIEQNLPMDGLKGLIVRENGKIVQHADPYFIEDINSIPLPKPQKYLDLKPYGEFDSTLQLQTKRGCSLKCRYCANKHLEGIHYRLRNPESIANYMEELLKETGISRFEFVDSTFNNPIDHSKAVLRAIIAKKLDVRLHTVGFNPGIIDEELVDLMKQAGFQEVSLGLDAGSESSMHDYGKDFTRKDIVRAAQLLHAKKIPVVWYLLMGSPNETYETIKEALNFVAQTASQLDFVIISVGVRVYKGSIIADQMCKDDPNCTRDNFLHPVGIVPARLSLDEVKALTKRIAVWHPNFIIGDEENTPLFVIKMAFTMGKTFFPRIPIWKFHIIFRIIQKWMGMALLKSLLHELRNRKILKKFKE